MLKAYPYKKHTKQIYLPMHASQFLIKLKNLSPQDVNDQHGIGGVLVDNLFEFLNSPRFDKLQNKFTKLESKDIGVVILSSQLDAVEGELSGETICITGTFEIPRPQIKTKLEALGGKVVDNVTSKTTILLAGAEAGSKLAKAKKSNIKIIEKLADILD
jgi:DNA ligase (NAD+)